MPALSKKQQRFFGIVRAIQKGEQAPTTPETAKAAEDMKKTDVKKFASTKHKGLPEKKVTTEELKLNRKISFPEMQKRIRDAKERAREKKKNPRDYIPTPRSTVLNSTIKKELVESSEAKKSTIDYIYSVSLK